MRLVRYGFASGLCFSSRPDAAVATSELARRFPCRGNNFGYPGLPTKRVGWLVSWLSDNRPWDSIAAGPGACNPEEKVPCSEGIYSGASKSSFGSQIKPISLKKIQVNDQENPAGRKLKTAKKEQDLSVNLSKKTPAKKIHS